MTLKCLNSSCNAEVENDDNFCYKCGQYTAKGYKFLQNKDNIKLIMNGSLLKQDTRFAILLSLLLFLFLLFILVISFRGIDIFKPLVFIEKKIDNYIYGYNSSIIRTDNIYDKKTVTSLSSAIKFIEDDARKQEWKCYQDLKVSKIENYIEEKYDIINVNFCDIEYNQALEIKNVIDKIYSLFSNISGTLTNITIANPDAISNSSFIAYFQPMYQFVNSNEEISSYNKVNKTQILLNSYYFLNDEIKLKTLNNITNKNWYVKDATLESIIAHEFGHYITFKIFLNKKNLTNIIYVNKNNYDFINNIISEFDKGEFSKDIVLKALNNYNKKYNTNLTIEEYANSISNYAAAKDRNGDLLVDETIAEAIHDYYLHGDNCNISSYEIINIIKENL